MRLNELRNIVSDVIIAIRDNGPLLIRGMFKLVDAEGNELVFDTGKPNCALCRCGASANKPFCDGAHKTCGFASLIRAPQ
jgi:CDGSH-type Zn-finger protein